MAKFKGMVGFALSTETAPGVWTDVLTDREYIGDVIRASRQFVRDDVSLNDNANINNRISIVADDFATMNMSLMRYVMWNGVQWKISNIEVQRPRLILTIGGVYNVHQN